MMLKIKRKVLLTAAVILVTAALVFGKSPVWSAQPDKTEQEYHVEASAYYKEGKYREAVDAWLNQFALNSRSPHTANNLGMAYHKLGEDEEALRYHKLALEIHPNFGHGHYSLGLLYLDTGHADLAREEFKRAIEIGYNINDSFRNLGLCYGTKEDIDKAEAEAEQAVKRSPGNAKSHLLLGLAYLLKEDYSKANREVKMAKELAPRMQMPDIFKESIEKARTAQAKKIGIWLFGATAVGVPVSMLTFFRKRREFFKPNRIKISLLTLFILVFPAPVMLIVYVGLQPALISLAISFPMAVSMVGNFKYMGMAIAVLHYAIVVFLNYLIVCALFGSAKDKRFLWAVPALLVVAAMFPIYPTADAGGGRSNFSFL
ncbi:MAG: tetratricopeptide repeat protein, partial [Nitrospirae bacterium]|nr:tetratricopeptide repeat protein [Nitrospirota bacterium]